MTDKDTKDNPSRNEIWLRGGFILIFALFYAITKIIIWTLVLFQFLAVVITNQTNSQLGRFSKSLSVYVYQLLQYVMFNTEDKPFPFSDWPEPETVVAKEKPVTKKKTVRKKKVVTKKEE